MPRRKPNTSGAADRRRRGLKSLLVPVRPDLHAAIKILAGYNASPATDWTAQALETAARAEFASRGLKWPQLEKAT